MKAMVLNAYGESTEFQKTELTKPKPAAGQVLVRVAATSVNTVDTMIRRMGQAELPLSPDLPGCWAWTLSGPSTRSALMSPVSRRATRLWLRRRAW